MPTHISPKLLVASVCGILATSAALAAAPAAPVIGEVIVTAQLRAQDVQDVPIAIDVISPEELATAGFKDANDLSKIAPVAQITQGQGTVSVTIRGIGDVTTGADTSVTSNIDGEYLNGGRALATALFDLERVEVLRGPQGTLYGRNSTAGAVNYIARKPGSEVGGNGSISYGNYSSVRADGGVNIPVTGAIAARVAGFYEDRDGYVKHPAFAGGNVGGLTFPAYGAFKSDDNNAWGGRIALQGKDLGNFSFYVAGEVSERKFTPQINAGVDTHGAAYAPNATCSNLGWARGAPLITNNVLCVPQNTQFLDGVNREEYASPANGDGQLQYNTYAFRTRLDYELSPAATLSYLGGFRNFEQDSSSQNSLPVVYVQLLDHDKTDTQSHELRLAGNVNNIIYQAGLFYFKQSTDTLNAFYNGDATPGTTNAGRFINTFSRKNDNESKSVFGQVELPFTDALTGVLGGRYTKNDNSGNWADKNNNTGWNAVNRPVVQNPAVSPALFNFSKPGASENKTTWLAGLNYKPDADTLYYGKVSTGFKGGGFDALGAFGPETNTAFEVGLKKQFGQNGQHVFNASAFRYDYKGLQVNVLIDSAVGGQTFNAGSATIWGLEADGAFELTDNDHVNLSFNYLNNKIDELRASFGVYCVRTQPFAGPPGLGALPGGCGADAGFLPDITSVGDVDPVTPGVQNPNFAGNDLAYAPDVIVRLGYDHVFHLGSENTVTFRANTTYKSDYFTSFYNYRDSQQEAFFTSDASLEYGNGKGLTVSAYVNNMSNKRILTNGTFTTAGPDDIWNYQFGSPRLYGLRLSMDWK
ncbi:MAG: TonB-dependent receptor [Steroidobacteraceae bacterium]